MKRFFMYGVIIFLTAQCNAKIYKQSLLNMILFSDLTQLEKTLTDEIEQIEKEINKIQQKFFILFS
ncbi:hypothetical protein GF322_02815, partial [Candidatus Dependentiae bacterium]|nr:hypothetical protein [Candidatus Dependentiae bacterium]